MKVLASLLVAFVLAGCARAGQVSSAVSSGSDIPLPTLAASAVLVDDQTGAIISDYLTYE